MYCFHTFQRNVMIIMAAALLALKGSPQSAEAVKRRREAFYEKGRLESQALRRKEGEISPLRDQRLKKPILPFHQKPQPDRASESRESIPDHNPALTIDEAGNMYLAWEHGNELWWAVNRGRGWKDFGILSGDVGTRPVILYIPGLLDQGASPGLFCAWESIDSPKKIISSIGKPVEEGVIWSVPKTLTRDDHDDHSLALVNSRQKPLLLWLQQGSLENDDTDLYFQTMQSEDSQIQWMNQEEEPAVEPHDPIDPFTPAGCLVVTLIKRSFSLPEDIPIIGGEGELKLSYNSCAYSGLQPLFPEPALIEPLLGGGLLAEISIGPHLAFSLARFNSIKSAVNTNILSSGGLLEGVALNSATSVSAACLSKPIPLSICSRQLGTSRLGPVVYAGVLLSYIKECKSDRRPFLLLTTSVEAGGNNTFSSSGNRVFGFVELVGGYEVSYDLLSPAGSFKTEPFISLDGKINVGGERVALQYRFIKTYAFKGLDRLKTSDPNSSESPLTVTSMKDIVSQARSFLTEEKVLIKELLECVKEPFTGTGSAYEGRTVLQDVSSDVYYDGLPSAARSESGQITCVWTKGLTAASLGSKVYAADYDANTNSWGDPVEITPEIDFHTDAVTAFDSVGTLMAVWSTASHDGLDYEKSSVEKILEAMDRADLLYARRIQGQWSAPQTLASLPGSDEQVALAAGPCGEIMAAWINRSGNGYTIYSSLWNGSGWTEPMRIAESALAEAPRIVYTLRKPAVIWAQDGDGRLDTPYDWRLYFALWDGGSWSSCPLSFEDEADQKGDTGSGEIGIVTHSSERQESAWHL